LLAEPSQFLWEWFISNYDFPSYVQRQFVVVVLMIYLMSV